jgi:hypothetical protein
LSEVCTTFDFLAWCLFKSVSGTNLARVCGSSQNQACTSSQSTYLDPVRFPASNGNDGVVDGFTHTGGSPGVCNELPYDLTPWWKDDLGNSASIGGWTIWGRSDCCQSHLDCFQIWVGDRSSTYNAAGNTKCYTSTAFEHQVPPYTHSFDCVSSGQYLWLVLATRNCLLIREIEVYSIGENSFLSQDNVSVKSGEGGIYGSSSVVRNPLAI